MILSVRVTPLGGAERVSIARSSGYFLLDEAARHAVEKWRFHPALAAGIAVPTETKVEVHFKAQE